MDVNAQMVREGMAWVYRQYAKDRGLYELERQAQASRRGYGLILSLCHHGSTDATNVSVR